MKLTNVHKHFGWMLVLGILAWAFAVGGYALLGVLVGAFCVVSSHGSGLAYNFYGGRLCLKS